MEKVQGRRTWALGDVSKAKGTHTKSAAKLIWEAALHLSSVHTCLHGRGLCCFFVSLVGPAFCLHLFAPLRHSSS